MKKFFCLLSFLLLSGCQSLPISKSADDSETNHQVQSTEAVEQTVVAPQEGMSLNQSEITQAAPGPTPQEQSNLWQRIIMQFSLPIPKNPKIDYYRRWYIKHPRHLQVVATRAAPFLYLITQKIEERHLPLELALLPVVESSYDAFAYSFGRAAGLWQFVPSTAKIYGLKQNYWYDGRRDVPAATDAALSYLSNLNKRFHGDWYHAIAAYNSGGGRVAQAIRKNKKRGQNIDFFSLDLPEETSSYVPKLIALVDVIAHHKQYGISLPIIPNRPVLKSVNPKEQLDLAVAAKYAGISIKELQSYNPAFNQWATAPNGPYSLLLPIDKVMPFQEEVAKNRGKGIRFIRYQIQEGDSISEIAEEYNTTPAVIQAANGIRGTNIRAGQYLMIPTSTKDEKKYALSMENRLKKIQSRVRGQYKMTHTVRAGESFWTIAQKYHVSHRALAKWNGMSPRDPLKLGKRLVIWKKATGGAVIRTLVYQVRSGDTLSGIANKFQLKIADIIQWNSLSDKKYLRPGQRLKLYVDVTKVNV